MKTKTFLLLLFLTGIGYGQVNRWSTKTITDGFVIPKVAKSIKIIDLQNLKIIKVGKQTPRLAMEKNLISVTGTVTKHVLEADGDWHTEINDGSTTHSLPCEAVDPNDKIAKTSPYIKDFIAVHEVINSVKVGDKIEITGIEFQDNKHGTVTERIPNFDEIHPITECHKIK
jgi:hypothetical protein